MSSIDSLLNHEPAVSAPTTATFEAADALTTLATLGNGQQYVPDLTRELPSPTAFSRPPRRASSINSQHAPVEPSTPLEQPRPHSQTLEHYHHGSQSPEEQKRRQSLMSRTSPAPVLAPLHNLSSVLQDRIRDETAEPEVVQSEPEPAATARENMLASSDAQWSQPNLAASESIDADTLRALEIAKQSELGLRRRMSSVAEGFPSPIDAKSAPAPPKKRPAPSSTLAIKKKGTAKAMKPSKKRKLDTEEPLRPRSVTPTSRPSKPPPSRCSKKGSQAGTPALDSSPGPDNSSQLHPSDYEGGSSEDHNLYCLCRKPDNHKWMIGCDGGCDDWFHGDCVNMKQADEGLVDKFICPACEENGKGNTTWKPMCRRNGCRRPARLLKGNLSKYCSDDCGVLFMSEQVQRTAGANGSAAAKEKLKRKKKLAEMEPVDEEEPTPLGGVLRAKDLKALLDESPNIQSFKNLGNGILSPPQTTSPTRTTFGSSLNGENLALTAAEIERLTALYNERSQLNDRLEALKDREKFVSMAKEQATRIADREKIKLKEFCGYDSRLSWSDAEFLLWRNSKHGCAAFKFSTLSPTSEQITSMLASHGLQAMDVEEKEGVCLKKRCAKHPQWQKLNLQDARFEELEVVEAIRECEKEERSVRERARRRGAKDGLARELTGMDEAKKKRNREGWVELVPL